MTVKTFMDGNEFRDRLEEARKERETLLKRRDEIEIRIRNLTARQMELQQALEQSRALKNIVDMHGITNQGTLVRREQRDQEKQSG